MAEEFKTGEFMKDKFATDGSDPEHHATGFYGKLRSHGDFVSRGLPHGFVQAWDAWLQTGLLTSQRRHGALARGVPA